MEVLQTITKTREEIRILRETYTARKTRKSSAQTSARLPVFRAPQQSVKRSRRVLAKPPLVMRHGYSSGERKEPYGVAQAYHQSYNYLLEKEE